MTPDFRAHTLVQYAVNRGSDSPLSETWLDTVLPGWRAIPEGELADLAALAEVRPDDAMRVARKWLADPAEEGARP